MLGIDSVVSCWDEKFNHVELTPQELQTKKIIGLLTMIPNINFEPFKKVQTTFNYIPLNGIKVFHRKDEIVNLTFKNNYDEIEHTIQIHPYNKVYTMNKGYIDVDNLGMMDVLVDGIGHICSIVKKEKEHYEGQFFTIDTKIGNNIVVNNLVVSPR